MDRPVAILQSIISQPVCVDVTHADFLKEVSANPMVNNLFDRLRSEKTAQIVGVFIALVGTAVFWYPPILSRVLPENLVLRNLCAQGFDWAFCLALVGVVLFWEKKPLSSLQFKALTVKNFSAGMGLGSFCMIGLVVWTFLIQPMIPGLDHTTASNRNEELPKYFFLWYAPIALVTASVCEEVIYRGYAMERLLLLTKRPWLAVVLTHISFVLYHIKDGLDGVIALSVLGLLFPIYYLKTRDLTVVIIGHALIDFLAIVGHFAGL